MIEPNLTSDANRSHLNKDLAVAVMSGSLGHVNLVEVDHVCDGGLELLRALRQNMRTLHGI